MNHARAYGELDALERMSAGGSALHRFDPRVKIIVAGTFLVLLLSIGSHDLPGLLTMAAAPLVLTLWAGIPAGFLYKRILLAMPFVIFIGIFNPVFDRETMLRIGTVNISGGWISFTAIMLRGILAVWMGFILLASTGFRNICGGLNRMKVPPLFTTLLLFVFRYIFLLLDEAARILHARALRNIKGGRPPLREWTPLIGTLLARSMRRAERIQHAMLARGFDGTFKTGDDLRLKGADYGFLVISLIVLSALRWGNFAQKTGDLFQQNIPV